LKHTKALRDLLLGEDEEPKKKKDSSKDLKQLLMQKLNGPIQKPFHFNISKTI